MARKEPMSTVLGYFPLGLKAAVSYDIIHLIQSVLLPPSGRNRKTWRIIAYRVAICYNNYITYAPAVRGVFIPQKEDFQC